MSRLVAYQKNSYQVSIVYHKQMSCFLKSCAQDEGNFLKLLYGTNYFYGFFAKSHRRGSLSMGECFQRKPSKHGRTS